MQHDPSSMRKFSYKRPAEILVQLLAANLVHNEFQSRASRLTIEKWINLIIYMETKRLFIAAVLVWVIGSVAIYYLYSRGHLQEVSNVSVPSLRLAPLRGLVSITPTATDVARTLEADVVSQPGETNPAVTPVELPVSSSSVPTTAAPTTAAPTTAAPTTAAPTPGRTKHGSEEQERRLGLAEKVDLPQDGSDIYISVLTTPGYHDSRLSRQYITWMQTVHPKQVRLAISNTTLQNCIFLVLAHIGRHTHLFFFFFL